jgi:hypothetical protein
LVDQSVQLDKEVEEEEEEADDLVDVEGVKAL